MALSTYKRKRKFGETPEPQGGQAASEELRFVVQKHQASRLHYDLRLELKGTLKSWAVPKGPSLNPDDKRLAVQVEDHPYDYKDFEGTIPKGNYGAGTVIIWDEGSYEPLEHFEHKKDREQALMHQWKDGHIKFRLKGKKLKGAFVLTRIKGDGPGNWLLIKHKDRYASAGDVTQKDRSVRSKKTIAQLTEKDGPAQKKAIKTRRSSSRTPKTQVAENGSIRSEPADQGTPPLNKLPAAPFPERVTPMLASLADAPFDGPDWTYEIKWDGYRAVAYRDKSKCMLLSRTGRSFETKFAPVFEALRSWKVNAVLDGEIVALDDKGAPDFNRLQNWRSAADGALHYYVFDLLWLEGKDTMQLPLTERQNILRTLLPEAHPVIKSSFSHSGSGIDFFQAAAAIGMEGIIAKRADSTYQPGHRSKAWLKIKARKRQEVVIGGYTRIAGTSRPFSALLLGVYQNGALNYAGRVGTGFKEAEQKELLRMFKGLERRTTPFSSVPEIGEHGRFRSAVATDVVWLKPELVCEIHFTEVTPEGIFRHPAFIALREDKSPRSVVLEDRTIMTRKNSAKSGKRTNAVPRQHLLIPADAVSDLSKRVNGVSLELTNPGKVLWPDDGYTKGDMLNYYNSMAPYILPYLKQRPQSLHRFPNGIGKSSFYQKDVTDKVPDWIEQYPYKVKGERVQKHYMLCNNKAALLYMANLGAIELHPWSSTIQRPDHPSWCILDIDPDTSNTFEQVIETAQAIFVLLEDIKVPYYCKTSGSTGLHIYIPLNKKYTYDQSQLLAQWVATTVSQQLKFTSVERMKSKRMGKIYIDYLQNRPAATLAAPYSLRPRPGATVSMPLYREEVKKGLKMKDLTIENALDRVRSEGDIFKPVLGKGINLKKVLEQIEHKFR